MAKIAVLVTTDSSRKGVFSGLIDEELILKGMETGVVTLSDVRNCIYWPRMGGFLSLAASGPNAECRIGAKADIVCLNGVTSISLLSPQAAIAWKEAPVYVR